jgi:hypothetical protein
MKMRELYIRELEDKRMKDHESYKKLIAWKTTLMTGGTADIDKISVGIEVVSEKYKAYVYVKRAGFKYENFRIDMKNAFDAGNDHFPGNVNEAYRRLASWRPMYISKTKEKETGSQFQQESEMVGEQHWEKGSTEEKEYLKNISCIRCERKGHTKKDCSHDTKEDGSELNSREHMDRKYLEFAVAKHARLSKTGRNALQHFM